VRRRVADACLSLLAEGNTELRPVDVAARAVVSRATVYRWWPTTEALVNEAMHVHVGARLDPPDTGSWAKDVRKYMTQLAAFFADPTEVALNAVMAQGRNTAQDEQTLAYYAPLYEGWDMVVGRAHARGELRKDVRADAIVMTFVSPLVLVPLQFRRPLSRREISAATEMLLLATTRT
jgi:AcrR family transcriptional regulator